MIVKPYISFLNVVSDAQLKVNTDAILVGMTDNPAYQDPVPTLAVVTTASSEFAAALADAENGGPVQTTIKNQKRAALVALLRKLASYVGTACNGDLAVLQSSGFPVQKPERTPVGVLPPPSQVVLTLGSRSGELQGIALPVKGAAIYNWKLASAAQPAVVLQAVQTTSARTVFPNLIAGQTYQLSVNVVGSAGPSSWTEPVIAIAL